MVHIQGHNSEKRFNKQPVKSPEHHEDEEVNRNLNAVREKTVLKRALLFASSSPESPPAADSRPPAPSADPKPGLKSRGTSSPGLHLKPLSV